MQPIETDFSETPYGIVKRLKVIEEWLTPFERPLRILDFGCGTGEQVTYPLARSGHTVVGLDVHPPSIEQAKGKYALPNLQFRVAAIDDLQREQGRFDAIVCSEVIEHLHDPVVLLTALHRLLVEGGRLIVTTPNGKGPYELLSSLEKRLSRNRAYQLVRSAAHVDSSAAASEAGFLNWESQHVQFFRLSDLERVFLAAGFRVVERRPRTFLCGPYVDLMFRWMPFRKSAIRLNANVADALPMQFAADWMFLLKKM